MKISTGFTLVELVVVLTLLAILSGVAFSAYLDLTDEATEARAKSHGASANAGIHLIYSDWLTGGSQSTHTVPETSITLSFNPEGVILGTVGQNLSALGDSGSAQADEVCKTIGEALLGSSATFAADSTAGTHVDGTYHCNGADFCARAWGVGTTDCAYIEDDTPYTSTAGGVGTSTGSDGVTVYDKPAITGFAIYRRPSGSYFAKGGVDLTPENDSALGTLEGDAPCTNC